MFDEEITWYKNDLWKSETVTSEYLPSFINFI